jgi:hypothetical protein
MWPSRSIAVEAEKLQAFDLQPQAVYRRSTGMDKNGG